MIDATRAELRDAIYKGFLAASIADTSPFLRRALDCYVTAAQEHCRNEYIKRLYPDYAGTSRYPWFIVQELRAKDLACIGLDIEPTADDKPRIGHPQRNKARAKMARESRRRNRI